MFTCAGSSEDGKDIVGGPNWPYDKPWDISGVYDETRAREMNYADLGMTI